MIRLTFIHGRCSRVCKINLQRSVISRQRINTNLYFFQLIFVLPTRYVRMRNFSGKSKQTQVFFYTTPLVAASDSPTTHGTVKPAAVPVFWFCNSMCFRFWSKTSTKRCSNNCLLSRDKSIFSLYDLIGHMLLISALVLRAGLNLDYPENPAKLGSSIFLRWFTLD